MVFTNCINPLFHHCIKNPINSDQYYTFLWQFNYRLPNPQFSSDHTRYKIFIKISQLPYKDILCPPAKFRGQLEFWVFGRGQNTSNFMGEGVVIVLWLGGVGVYFVGGGQFILCQFSHFEIQDFQKKTQNFLLVAASFSIFTFPDLRQVQAFK